MACAVERRPSSKRLSVASILMTRAPRSANRAAPYGPAWMVARSRIVTPDSGCAGILAAAASATPSPPAAARGRGARLQASQHFGVVLSHIWGWSAWLARGVLEIHQRGQGAQRAHTRIMDRDHGPVGEHRRMLHGLDAVPIGLSGDVAVLEIQLHPLVGGFLQLLLQDLPAQELAGVHAEGGNILEPFILQQVPKANGLEMALDVWDPLIGVLEPCAVPGPHGNISDGGEASAAGPPGKPLRVHTPELHIHQSTVTDIVVVGRGQALDDAGLDPLPTPAEIPHAEGAHDPAHRRLAGVPAARVHRR